MEHFVWTVLDDLIYYYGCVCVVRARRRSHYADHYGACLSAQSFRTLCFCNSTAMLGRLCGLKHSMSLSKKSNVASLLKGFQSDSLIPGRELFNMEQEKVTESDWRIHRKVSCGKRPHNMYTEKQSTQPFANISMITRSEQVCC